MRRTVPGAAVPVSGTALPEATLLYRRSARIPGKPAAEISSLILHALSETVALFLETDGCTEGADRFGC